MSSEKNPPIQSSEFTCMQCGKSASLIQVPDDIPLFGEILLQTILCTHCGFKWSDVMSLEFGKPLGYEAHITSEADLSTKIVRNSNGTVEIPELGVLLEPGPFAEGFITNIEGLLERVDEALSMLSRSEDGDQAHAAKERKKELLACRAGKKPFTVKVLDPFGGSALIGKHVKRWELSEEEAKSLKKGMLIQ